MGDIKEHVISSVKQCSFWRHKEANFYSSQAGGCMSKLDLSIDNERKESGIICQIDCIRH